MCVNAYDRSSLLRFKRGLIGYAVYCRLLELCASAPGGRLKFDAEAVAWDLRDKTVNASLVESVVSDYELFIRSDDGFIEDAFNPSSVYLQKQREQEIKAARSAAGRKGAATRAANKANTEPKEAVPETPLIQEVATEKKKEEEQEQQTTVVQKKKTNSKEIEQEDAYYKYPLQPKQSVEYDRDKLEKVRAVWNNVYKGVRGSAQTWFAPPQAVVETFRGVAEYSVDDFRDAFQMARKDPKITWKFEAAIRQVGFLLGKIETEKNALEQKQREQDERDGIDRTSLAYKENVAAIERMFEEGAVVPTEEAARLREWQRQEYGF